MKVLVMSCHAIDADASAPRASASTRSMASRSVRISFGRTRNERRPGQLDEPSGGARRGCGDGVTETRSRLGRGASLDGESVAAARVLEVVVVAETQDREGGTAVIGDPVDRCRQERRTRIGVVSAVVDGQARSHQGRRREGALRIGPPEHAVGGADILETPPVFGGEAVHDRGDVLGVEPGHREVQDSTLNPVIGEVPTALDELVWRFGEGPVELLQEFDRPIHDRARPLRACALVEPDAEVVPPDGRGGGVEDEDVVAHVVLPGRGATTLAAVLDRPGGGSTPQPLPRPPAAH